MAATLNILFRFKEDDKTSYLNLNRKDIIEPGLWEKCLVIPTATPSLKVRIGDPEQSDPLLHRGTLVTPDGMRIEINGTVDDDDSFASLGVEPGDPVHPRTDFIVCKYKHEEVEPAPVPQFKVLTGPVNGPHPEDPQLAEDETFMASIRVNPGSSQITEEDILWARENATGQKLERQFAETVYATLGEYIIGDENSLKVTPGAGLQALIEAGKANIDGIVYHNVSQRGRSLTGRRQLLQTGGGPNLTINPLTPIHFPTQLILDISNLNPQAYGPGSFIVRGTDINGAPQSETITIDIGQLENNKEYTTTKIFKTVDNNGIDVVFPGVNLTTLQTQIIVRIKDRPINKIWAIGHGVRETTFLAIPTQELPPNSLLIATAVTSETDVEQITPIRSGNFIASIQDLLDRVAELEGIVPTTLENDLSTINANISSQGNAIDNLASAQQKLVERSVHGVRWSDVNNSNIEFVGQNITITGDNNNKRITFVCASNTGGAVTDPQNFFKFTPQSSPINPAGEPLIYHLQADGKIHYWDGTTDIALGEGGGGSTPATGSTRNIQLEDVQLDPTDTPGNFAIGRINLIGFGENANSRVNFSPFRVPDDYIAGTDMEFQFCVTPIDSAGGTARFKIAYDVKDQAELADGQYDDNSAVQEFTIAANANQQLIVDSNILKIPASELSVGKNICLAFMREGTHGNDNAPTLGLWTTSIKYEATGGSGGGSGDATSISGKTVYGTPADGQQMVYNLANDRIEWVDAGTGTVGSTMGSIPLSLASPDATFAPTSGNHGKNVGLVQFNGNVKSGINFHSFLVPEDYNGGDAFIKLAFATKADNAGFAKFDIAYDSRMNEASDGGYDDVLASELFTVPSGVNVERTQTGVTLKLAETNLAKGKTIYLSLFRDGADASDTSNTNNLVLLASELKYSKIGGSGGGDSNTVHGVPFEAGTPTDGDSWVYDSGENEWKHQPVGGINTGDFVLKASNLSDLSDKQAAVDNIFDKNGTGNAIDSKAAANKLRFYYDTLAGMPSASDYHGMIGHAHDQGRPFLAHNGNWLGLALQSEIPVASGDTAPGLIPILVLNNDADPLLQAGSFTLGNISGKIEFAHDKESRVHSTEIRIPPDYSTGSDMHILVDLISRGTTAGNARMEVKYDIKTDGDVQDGLIDEGTIGANIALPVTTNTIKVMSNGVFTIPSANLAAGRLLTLTVIRRGDDNTNDTSDDPVGIAYASISYTRVGGDGAGVVDFAEIIPLPYFSLDDANPAQTATIGAVKNLISFPKQVASTNVLTRANACVVPMPLEWKSGTDVILVVDYVSDGTSGQSVKFNVNWSLKGDAENFTGSYMDNSHTILSAVPLNAGEKKRANIVLDGSSFTMNKNILISLARDGVNATDTNSNNIVIVNAFLKVDKRINVTP